MHHIDLVGVSHRDPKIETRLWNAYKVLRPDVMTLEYPYDQIGFINWWGSPEVQKGLAVIRKKLSELLDENLKPIGMAYGDEVATMCKIYSESKTPLYCVDSLRAKQLLMESPYLLQSLLSMINQAKASQEPQLLAEDDYDRFGKDFIESEKVKRKNYNVLRSMKKTGFLTRERETFQRDRIKEILMARAEASDDPVRLMHVGGMAHLANAKEIPTLYRYLRRLSPSKEVQIRRYAARDFDSFTDE